MKNNKITFLFLEAILLICVVCLNFSCIGKPQYQTISHNKLYGKTDYIHFSSVDTGYVITHIGDLYDSVHCTYVYQTVDGGAYWEIVDSIPNFSFCMYSHTTYRNIVYGYMNNGSQSRDGYWNSYLCMIDLKNHQHKVRNETFYGPGDVFYCNNYVHFPVYIDKNRYIIRLDGDLNDVLYESNTFPKNIKDISYNDSLLAFITYDKKVYYLQAGQMSEHQIDFPCNEILLSREDCYITYWGAREHDAGMIRITNQSDCYETLNFPSGYKVVNILKSKNDSIIITCTRDDICTFPKDIVYSADKGLTWKKISLKDPIISPMQNSCYCAPYLYIKSTFSDEIYKLYIK